MYPPPIDHPARRWLISALVVLPALLGMMIFADRAAAAPPVPSFSVSPSPPVVTDETVTFTSTSTDPDDDIVLLEWDFDNDGFDDGSGPTVDRIALSPGQYPARLRVTDAVDNVRTTPLRTITVRENALPTAAISASPASPERGQAVTLTSESIDPDNRPLDYAWDLGDDGTVDGTDHQIATSFPSLGMHTVSLFVTDSGGLSDVALLTITVRNSPPSASFGYAPAHPATGDQVVLTSTSSDRDGTVAQHNWDLDGDGQFDDESGGEVRTSFAEPGSHMVSLQVVDNDGAPSAAAFASIDVARGPPAPTAFDLPLVPPAPTGRPVATRPSVISPLPRVRVRGVTTAKGARIDFLTVRTRGGTRIRVRCKGRGCPWARNLQRARFRSSLVRTVRIQGFRRRHLRAGAVIEVFVTRAAMIGKYMRLRIRPGMKPPKRVDACTSPGGGRVRKCPAA